VGWARLQRTRLGGTAVVVKTTDYDARLEAEGLSVLGEAGAPVARVVDCDPTRLVLEDATGPPEWEEVGRGLARAHRATADRYGYHHDNVLGPLAQANRWTDGWADFYAQHRLIPHLEVVPTPLSERLRGAIDSGRLEGLLEHGQRPGLVHGDLWSGNVVDGRRLIDPAVHYADRELDRAFADLFGGIPHLMWTAYEEEWPMDDGWQERRPALQLYHLLVHVRLFGGAYVEMVTRRLDRLGW
jgi:fructosamine-3-kinase